MLSAFKGLSKETLLRAFPTPEIFWDLLYRLFEEGEKGRKEARADAKARIKKMTPLGCEVERAVCRHPSGSTIYKTRISDNDVLVDFSNSWRCSDSEWGDGPKDADANLEWALILPYHPICYYGA